MSYHIEYFVSSDLTIDSAYTAIRERWCLFMDEVEREMGHTVYDPATDTYDYEYEEIVHDEAVKRTAGHFNMSIDDVNEALLMS